MATIYCEEETESVWEVETNYAHLLPAISRCGMIIQHPSRAFLLDVKDLSSDRAAPSYVQDTHEALRINHWVVVRRNNEHSLKSRILKEVFRYLERAPLLCIIDDFLQELDQLFLEHEAQVEEKGGNGGTETEGKVENVDGMFVRVLELRCLLHQRALDIRHFWHIISAELRMIHGKTACFADEFYPCIQEAIQKLTAHCSTLVQEYEDTEGAEAAKYSLLCKKLGLSKKEQIAFSFIFIQNVGNLFSLLHSRFSNMPSSSSLSGSHSSSMALAAASFAELSGREKLEFFDSEREHMQQELLEPDDEYSSITTSSFLKIPSTVLKACCGCSLTAEELYKIDKTAMAAVLVDVTQKPGPGVVTEGTRGEEEKGGGVEGGKGGGGEGGKEGVGEGGGGEVEEEEEEEEEEMAVELEEILKTCDAILQRASGEGEKERGEEGERGGGEGGAVGAGDTAEDSSKPLPYKTDLEYLEDNFELIETLVKARKTEMSDDVLLMRPDQRKPEAVVRELRAKARGLRAKIDLKMEVTRTSKTSSWLPRLERLASLRKLDSFEKNVLLILTGSMVSRNLRNSGGNGHSMFGHHLNIGFLIGLFCEGLQEQIQSRIYFYKNSKLVSEGLVHVSDPPLHARGNFLDSVVELDRRLLDYIVGLDTEINELVDGSDLYTPDVKMSDVALPAEHRQLLVNTFESFGQFQKTCKELGLSTKGSTRGICLLFYGPSGTGKTMTANAVANYLGKKVLLVTVSLLTEKDLTKDLLRFLFREAKIHNAVLFFDECEIVFESREHRLNPTLGVLLTEVEQYEGIIILATNRQQDLDEAMHRRIQLALPFSVPDYALREEIWKSHVPAAVASGDIDWTRLALGHELTGGLIRNAVLSALSLAIKEVGGVKMEEEAGLVVREVHLATGAKLQLRGLLEMVDFERRVIPTFGLSDLVLDVPTLQYIDRIIGAGKSRKFISAQWGFGSADNVATSQGIVCLLCGDPGTGKSAIAHAIAYELGQPVKEATCTELLSHSVTVSPRVSRGVAAFFKDAMKANAVVLLDGADILLGSLTSGFSSGVVGCENHTLAYQIEHFSGVVILTCRCEPAYLDLSRLPKLRHVVELRLPKCELRECLWRKLLPKKAPVGENIDYKELAERYEFNGGEVASAICMAAERAARLTTKGGTITNANLVAAAEEERERGRNLRRREMLSIYK